MDRLDLSRPGTERICEIRQDGGHGMDGEGLDDAIGTVPNSPCDAEQSGTTTHEGTKANALHLAFDFDLNRGHRSGGYTSGVLSVLLPLSDPALSDLTRRCVEQSLAALAPNAAVADVGAAVGIVDRAAGTIRWGGFNETKPHYPASSVKLFWLAYAHHRIADGKLRRTPELDRAMHDMIVDSVNDATALVVDATTETTGGAELGPRELKRWMEKRQAANRWFASMGYTGINASQKTWNEGPYGRERQGYGKEFELRNAMSPLAGMRLLSEIMLDRIVDPKSCLAMRELLHRTKPDDGQRKDFTGGEMGPGCGIWSKAGWTSTAKCDLAWIKAPDGREIVLSVFTENSARVEELLPRISHELLAGLNFPVR